MRAAYYHEKGNFVTLALPKELRIFIALAAAALLGGLMVGFTPQQAGATPVNEGPFVHPCVSYATGQILHANGACPAGTSALDVSTGFKTLCVNGFTKKMSFRNSTQCNSSEFGILVDGSREVWGCVNHWTGAVTWMPSKVASCFGQALPFDVGFEGCGGRSAPVGIENFAPAPSC